MSTAAAYASGMLAVLERDARIYVSYRARLIGELLSLALILVFFWFFSRLVSGRQFPTPDDYFAFVLVGAVVFRSMLSSFNTSAATVRQELVAGTFERMTASPFGPTAGTVSITIFPVLLGVALAFVGIVGGGLAFGVPLSWSTLPLAVPAALVVVLAFVPVSLLINALVVLFKQATGVGVFIILIPLFSGLLFPPDILPGWLQWVPDVQPFTPAVDLLRHLMVGTPLEESAWVVLGKVAAFAVVLLPLALFVVHGAVRIGRRRATLIEY